MDGVRIIGMKSTEVRQTLALGPWSLKRMGVVERRLAAVWPCVFARMRRMAIARLAP